MLTEEKSLWPRIYLYSVMRLRSLGTSVKNPFNKYVALVSFILPYFTFYVAINFFEYLSLFSCSVWRIIFPKSQSFCSRHGTNDSTLWLTLLPSQFDPQNSTQIILDMSVVHKLLNLTPFPALFFLRMTRENLKHEGFSRQNIFPKIREVEWKP